MYLYYFEIGESLNTYYKIISYQIYIIILIIMKFIFILVILNLQRTSQILWLTEGTPNPTDWY